MDFPFPPLSTESNDLNKILSLSLIEGTPFEIWDDDSVRCPPPYPSMYISESDCFKLDLEEFERKIDSFGVEFVGEVVE